MLQTSGKVRASKRGFTLIEMIVTIIVLSVLAAIVWPNVVRERESRERREFFADLTRLAGRGRELAISGKRPIVLTLETSGREFALTREAEEEGEEAGTIDRLAIPEGIETGNFSSEGSNANSAEWQIRFYPDGSSDGGGVEVTDNGRVRALEIKPEGMVRLIDGPLEEMGTEKWPAGDYEKRI